MSDRKAADRERNRLKRLFPRTFEDGLQVGLGKIPAGPRLKGGYPLKYFNWQLEQRNAWWAGAGLGYWRRHGYPALGREGEP